MLATFSPWILLFAFARVATAVQKQVRETDRVPARLRDACVLGYKTCAPLFTTGYNGMSVTNESYRGNDEKWPPNEKQNRREISMLDVTTRIRDLSRIFASCVVSY